MHSQHSHRHTHLRLISITFTSHSTHIYARSSLRHAFNTPLLPTLISHTHSHRQSHIHPFLTCIHLALSCVSLTCITSHTSTHTLFFFVNTHSSHTCLTHFYTCMCPALISQSTHTCNDHPLISYTQLIQSTLRPFIHSHLSDTLISHMYAQCSSLSTHI